MVRKCLALEHRHGFTLDFLAPPDTPLFHHLKSFLKHLATTILATTLHAPALGLESDSPSEVGFSSINTSQVAVVQALLMPGGSGTQQVHSIFSAFLIKHDGDYLLLDTATWRR